MFRILNYSKLTNEIIDDLETKIIALDKFLILIEEQNNMAINSNTREEIMSYVPKFKGDYKLKLYDPIGKRQISKYTYKNKTELIYEKQNSLINKYLDLSNKYNVQLNKYNQIKDIIKGIESTNERFHLIKFGYDRKGYIICFLASKINENSVLNDFIIEGYIIDKDYFKNNKNGYLQLNYKPNRGCIELAVIDMRNNKNLGRGSFALDCIENTVIKDINNKIKGYNEENTSSGEVKYISKVVGTIGGILSSMMGRIPRKRFYRNNGYIFVDGNKFMKKVLLKQ